VKAKRDTEGKLSGTEITDAGALELDPDALGTITDLPDFLEKVRRLRGEIVAPEGSLRAVAVRQIEHLASHVEAFLAGPHNSPAAEHALLHMLHAAAHYTHLLAELADDARSDRRRRLTRAQYLAATRRARNRTELALLLEVTPQGLRAWEGEHLGGRRWSPARRAKGK
jgi:hypothetical protein